jgi:hypothetical protein
MGWREAARAEATSLKPYYVIKHGWNPVVLESDDEVLDLSRWPDPFTRPGMGSRPGAPP